MSKREVKRKDVERIILENGFASQEMCNTGIIQMDSIQYIEFIVELEEKYNIEIPDKFLTPNNTWNLDELVDLIRAKMSGLDAI